MAKKTDEYTEDEVVIDQETVDTVFGGINQYNTDYNKILDDQDAYLEQSYANQKTNAAKSYQQEQSAAYSDYQRQVDPYGAQAEQLAASGLSNSGYAESLKTQAYVAYQNRVGLARQSYEDALVSFDLAFKEAKMQNDYNRAMLAYQTYQMQLEGIISMISSDNPAAFVEAGKLMRNLNPNKWQEEYNKTETPAETAVVETPAETAHRENVENNGYLNEGQWEYAKQRGAFEGMDTYQDYLNWVTQFQYPKGIV